jgi:hypothetical protein
LSLNSTDEPACRRAAAPSGLTVPAPVATRPESSWSSRARRALRGLHADVQRGASSCRPRATTSSAKTSTCCSRCPTTCSAIRWQARRLDHAGQCVGRTDAGRRFASRPTRRAAPCARGSRNPRHLHLVSQAHPDHLTSRPPRCLDAGGLAARNGQSLRVVDSHCHLSSPELAGRIPGSAQRCVRSTAPVIGTTLDGSSGP